MSSLDITVSEKHKQAIFMQNAFYKTQTIMWIDFRFVYVVAFRT